MRLGWLANLSEPASPSEKAVLSGAPDTSVLQPGCGRCLSQSSVPPSFESKVTVSHQTTRTSLHQARSAPPPTQGLRSDPGCVPRMGHVRPTEKLGGPWVVARGADAGSCRSPTMWLLSARVAERLRTTWAREQSPRLGLGLSTKPLGTLGPTFVMQMWWWWGEAHSPSPPPPLPLCDADGTRPPVLGRLFLPVPTAPTPRPPLARLSDHCPAQP